MFKYKFVEIIKAMSKKLFLIALLFFLINQVTAETNITYILPEDGNTCMIPENVKFYFYSDDSELCDLYTNETGVWNITKYLVTINSGYNTFYYNFTEPNTLLTGLVCGGVSTLNHTFIITDKPYCAVLSGTTCPNTVNLDSKAVFKTRLSNTKGIYLENQDCNVWIEDSDGVIVENYPSMMYNADVSQALDDQGNVINLIHSNYPVTDSNGYYVFPFIVDSKWAYYGDEYSIHATCNGMETSCSFNVTKQKLPDVENYTALGKEAGGIFALFFGLIVVAYIIYKKRGAIR
jgi:hypothetical protein